MTHALSIHPSDRSRAWIAAALLAGLLVAVLPPALSLLALAVAVLSVLSVIDLRVALVVTLTLAPLKTLIETESPLSLPLDIGQLALMATLGIWLARSIAARRRLDLVWTPMYIPIALFTIAASSSLWIALSPGATLTELLKWIEMLAVIALVVSLMCEHGGNVDGIVGAILVSAVVQAIIGVYQFRGGSGASHLWILDFRYFRAFGTFGQPNPFGAFMGLTLPIAIGASFGTLGEAWAAFRSSRLSWTTVIRAALYILSALIIAVGLVVSWSRGAWLGFAAAALVLILFTPRRRWLGVGLVTVVVLVGVGSLAVGLIPESLLARFSDFAQDLAGFEDVRGQVISDANYAVLERFAHWQAAISMANDSPWLGVGFGNYEVAYPRYELMNWPFALGHAHNYYLNLLAETGIVGLAAYLMAWMMIVGLTLRVLRREVGLRRGVALGLLGAWAHLMAHSLFDKLYVNNLFLHIGAMLGLIGGLLVLGHVSCDFQTRS